MEICVKKQSEELYVQCNLKFDHEEVFCGQPYISLSAWKKSYFDWQEDNAIIIGIHDNDDYDIGFKYLPTEEQFFDVLHELINWMHDLENGLIIYDSFITDIEKFFPNLNCERKEW